MSRMSGPHCCLPSSNFLSRSTGRWQWGGRGKRQGHQSPMAGVPPGQKGREIMSLRSQIDSLVQKSKLSHRSGPLRKNRAVLEVQPLEERLVPSQVNLFSIPTPNSLPTAITAGSDGNLWFTETQANKIASI